MNKYLYPPRSHPTGGGWGGGGAGSTGSKTDAAATGGAKGIMGHVLQPRQPNWGGGVLYCKGIWIMRPFT